MGHEKDARPRPDLATSCTSAVAKDFLPTALREQRRNALLREQFELQGPRKTYNIALDEGLSGWPSASNEQPGAEAAYATDGDPATAWRGRGEGPWTWELPFSRVVRLGLLRFLWGDSSEQGVPTSYRVEIQRPVEARGCEEDAPWELLPGGLHDDRDGNTFLHGPQEIHARHQALFANTDACALRLHVEAMAPGQAPVLRELRVLEGAPSIAEGARISAEGTRKHQAAAVAPEFAIDGSYERHWAGEPGLDRWQLTLLLPSPRIVDRLWLSLGYDGVTEELPKTPGRRYTGAHLPLVYTVSTAHDEDPAHLIPLPEASAPTHQGRPLPVRRRLVKLRAPRPVQLLRLTITEATGPWGERDRARQAPVVRDLRLYEAADPRPVVTEPIFFSVDANPSGLTRALKGGEANSDGIFARTAFHRLRRTLLGFDADTRWPADATRRRDDGTGRFLEVIEGDDPLLSAPLLNALAPPPVLLLSGAFDWDFGPDTRRSAAKKTHWSWDVDAPASSPDRGMGQLRSVVQRRSVPAIGFCGGAQILALLESLPPTPATLDLDDREHLDRVLLRNGNQPIQGLIQRKDPYELAWWFDKPERDPLRPTMFFSPFDPLLGGPAATGRSSSRELPSSHGDMLRASAFSGPLRRFLLVGWSHFCRPWVDPEGPEPTWPDPADPSRRCVLVPQAFRSLPRDGYPLIGFQFHPEQRDLQRLAPGSPADARGDAMNLIANSVALVLDAYERLFWPDA